MLFRSLAEQAGNLTRARAAFVRVVQADPDFHDAAERLERLGPPRSDANRTR